MLAKDKRSSLFTLSVCDEKMSYNLAARPEAQVNQVSLL